MHDECNGSDVFGSDICTCRPYLIHGIEECARAGQSGGLGIIIYNRKEGRALGEVTKFLVYNARKRQEGGDAAAQYFERTECVAGVQDARFQQLMPDVVHWLGLKRIDRFVSMSDMKHDALTGQGIEIVERVPIPDDLVPADAHVEIAAKKAAGYYTPEPPKPQDLHQLGRPLAGKILRAARCPWQIRDVGRFVIVECQGGSRARASYACHRPRRPAAEFPYPSRPHRRTVDLVLETTRKAYPSLDVPFHSRWRHFGIDWRDRWAAIGPHWPDRAAARPRRIRSGHRQRLSRCRRRPVMALPRSGAPARPSAVRKAWRWPALRCSRAAPSRPIRCSPLRVDAEVLANLSVADIERGMQVSDANPLVGIDGRADLLRRLGATGGRKAGCIRQPRHAAARRPVRSAGDAGRRPADFRRRRSCPSCCNSLGRSGRRG